MMINLTIDGAPVCVPEGTSILEAAKTVNIKIPTLCYHEDLDIKASCRLCVVEVNGAQTLQTSCSTKVEEGMVVRTNTGRIIRYRRNILELLFARHPHDCLSCTKNGKCELQKLAADLGRQPHLNRYVYDPRKIPVDDSSPALVREPSKCVLCRRCVDVCAKGQLMDVIALENRGYRTNVVPVFGKKLADTPCVNCGQCYQVCPTGAISIHDDTWRIYEEFDEGKDLVVQVAPSVRINLAECLGQEPGTVSTGKMITALKKLGFKKVLDSDFAADLTIMEEGTELLNRLNNNGVLPMITSCCPAWIKCCETYYPEQRKHLSSCKSPQQMFGALIKTWCSEKMGLNPENIVSVSVMPCTAKKFEITRPEMNASGFKDVDISITVQELANMIKAAGIDFNHLEETAFDSPTGTGSGAGLIFGATGGVMEAALRTVYELTTGKTLDNIEFDMVRGTEGIKTASIDLNGRIVKVCVAHGLNNAHAIMKQVEEGTADFDFIEIMACPGGCVGGGGNAPRTKEKVLKRLQAVYEAEKALPIRKSHENPEVQYLYKDFLDSPNSELAHKYLHTEYVDRSDLLR